MSGDQQQIEYAAAATTATRGGEKEMSVHLVEVKQKRSIDRVVLDFINENRLLVAILISILIGFGMGIGLRQVKWSSPDDKLWFTLPGMLFIRSLELLILPVIFVGVISATSSLSAKTNLRLTLISVGYCFLTHILATLTALVGSIIYIAAADDTPATVVVEGLDPTKQKTVYDIIVDILRNLIPKNIVKSTTHQELTRYYYTGNLTGTPQFRRSVEYIDGTNILGVLTFAILIGLSASMQDEKAKLFRDFFRSLNDVVIMCLRWLITLAPIGIASLIIEACFDVDDFGESFKRIGLFTGICVAALLFYGVVVLCLLIFISIRKNPLPYYAYFLEPSLLAFASGSGAVCIHKGIDVCENKLKMDPRVARFGIPFYTALQADGSAVFIVMSCTFLTYYEGSTLSVGDFAVIIIMTTILCLCLPSVPSSSIVTILVVLSSVNQTPNIAILYTVEWLLDRIRTGINFYSHCFCTVITYELCKKSLPWAQVDGGGGSGEEQTSNSSSGDEEKYELGQMNPSSKAQLVHRNKDDNIETVDV